MTKPKKSTPTMRIEFGTILLMTGALANVTLWIGAFSSTEAEGPVTRWMQTTMMPVLGSVAGFAMGVTAVAGLVLVLWRLASMQPTYERKVRGKDEYKTYVNYRYWMTVGVLVTLLAVSWALLSPFEFGRLKGVPLYEVLGDGGARWWSAGRVLAADLILAAIALVTGSHVGATRSANSADRNTPLSEGSGTRATRSGKGSGRKAKAANPAAIVPCPHAGAGCTRTGTQNAMNAHASKCGFKPTISMPADISNLEKEK